MTNSVTNTSRKNFIRDTSKLSLFPARPKNCRREMHVCFPSCHNWGRAVVLHPVGPGDPAWTRQAGPQPADLRGDHRGLLRGVAGSTPEPALPDVRGFGSATSSDVHLGRPHLHVVRRAVPAPPVGRAGVLPAKQDVGREREGRGRQAAGQGLPAARSANAVAPGEHRCSLPTRSPARPAAPVWVSGQRHYVTNYDDHRIDQQAGDWLAASEQDRRYQQDEEPPHGPNCGMTGSKRAFLADSSSVVPQTGKAGNSRFSAGRFWITWGSGCRPQRSCPGGAATVVGRSTDRCDEEG